MVIRACTESLSKKGIQKKILLEFPIPWTHIYLTEGRNFKTFWKQNYVTGLNSCYLFNVEHGTEHDIDSAYGVCMH